MSERRFLSLRVPLQAAAAVAVSGLLIAGLSAPGVQAQPSSAASRGHAALASGTAVLGENGPEVFSEEATGLPDVDNRGTVTPHAAQISAVPAGVTVRWNRYGTPESLISTAGYLSGPAGGGPISIARDWLSSHADLFGLSRQAIHRLVLVNDTALTQSDAHVVLLRQQFGDLTSAVDGLATVGVTATGEVAYVSSSLARTTAAPVAKEISPVEAWDQAATDVALPDVPSDLSAITTSIDARTGWTTFTVPGIGDVQRARLRALAMPGGTVRPVFEVNVVNLNGGATSAYTSFVDAVNGDILVRHNQVDNLGALPASEFNEPFQGTITATDCDTDHAFDIDAATKTITASAAAAVTTNDIVLKLLYGGQIVATSDNATSPEALAYSVPAGADGTYQVRVCPFSDPTAPYTDPGDYAGAFAASEQAAPSPSLPYPPKWKYFVANPSLIFSPTDTTDNRQIACWVIPTPHGNCQTAASPLNNLAARGPWDYDFRTNMPTNTTAGNAAVTGEAWLSPLSPGGAHQMPVSPDREYGIANPGQDFTDAWNNTQCSPTAFTPAANNNDILASVTNLFAGHNRMHDFSYFLGFDEANYNMQNSNFGNTAPGPYPAGREGDAEVGNVQAGALTGGQPSFLGRDNANQITLQDGIPGITNQYLFQPIAGAFYSPCADGDFDAPVYGHEYTHAISNRMVAGPDAGLAGLQAGSMGESWSDQVALEYLFEHHYDIGADSPWVEGPYVTGNKVTGIRNYALDDNPLQYGDLGYDVTGPEVHADGEVWSAVMFDVRRELVAKYDAAFPQSDKQLQLRCADGDTSQQPPTVPLPAGQCPGGRRWIQLMFDSFLLQQSGTSMLDARDAYLAADKMRFGGRDLAALWQGFASDGMGENASTTSTEDDQPKSDYTSPYANEATLKLSPQSAGPQGGVPVNGTLYVGNYEARVSPIADTDPNTVRPATVRLVPGTYDFVFQADGYGLTRFTQTVRAGTSYVRQLNLSPNVASASNGAVVDGSSASINAGKLIDDTEASNWAGTSAAGVSVDAPASQPFVNIDLAGGRHIVRSVKVSAMLRPAGAAQDEDPNTPDDAPGARFTALRQFAIEVCTESATSDCSSTLPSGAPGSPYTRIYTSQPNAFDGVAPRPLAPTMLFKQFDVPDTAATHVRLVALENQCTGQSQFAGEQDTDPANSTDCKEASTQDETVRAAEFEVFS